ncbi:GAF:ATP-binding region, ATPase-like [Janibacter sp. HTCC2649]|uniref:GAF domain-containing sensor histidine kinase n=1 Tax=Janibacter sp. HTCC2649 TaxID=313589 RepID=UPI000066EC5B|nr:GAF domain-containing sensor histidine kinase [Janibacter sp. HTCC2649]EAP98929.1 GAF:ATP-binding region, ATPase-like [Janibacter sp. HTCC2649]
MADKRSRGQIPKDSAESATASLWSASSLQLDDLLEELRARAGSARESQVRMASLLDAVVAVSSDLDLADVLHRIVVSACELVDATYGALGVLGPSGEELIEFVTHGLSDEERAAIGPLPRGHGLLGLIITSPQPQRVSDIGQHTKSYGFPANHPPMTSFLGAPVRIRDEVFGNLYLTDKRQAKEFSQDDEAILVALAAAAGVAIENARLYDRTRGQQLWSEVAGRATQGLLAGEAHDVVLSEVAHRVVELTEATSCFVALTRGTDLMVVASTHAGPEVGTSVGDLALRAAMLAQARSLHVDTAGTIGTRSTVPLVLGEAPLGLIVVDWEAEQRLSHLPELSAFAERLTVSLVAASAQTERARAELYEDRDRIARDMHDHVIQRLFATGMSLQSAARLSNENVRPRLERAVDDLDAAIKDIRHTIFALHRPPGARELASEITAVCRDASVTLGFPPELRLSGRTNDLPEQLEADVLAVLREGLSNVARHAGATTVEVAVEINSRVAVTVADDGHGLDPKRERSSGLDNLARRAESRGGTLLLETREPSGTLLVWSVPLRVDRES